MADISTFPTIHNVLITGDNTRTFTATEAVSAGMVVGYAATGVSNAVVPLNATAGEQPIGVAMYDAGAGSLVAVCMNGCEVVVANYDDTTGIDAGDHLALNDNAVGGTVGAAALGIQTADVYYLGIALEDIAGAGTGKALVSVGVFLDGTD